MVSAFSQEIASEAARSWLSDAALSGFATSVWCETEIASALAVKVRRKEIVPEDYETTAEAIRGLLRGAATSIPIAAEHFIDAAELIRLGPKPLRAGDALHLAIAKSHGATVWTLDCKMAEAGQALGLGTRLLA